MHDGELVLFLFINFFFALKITTRKHIEGTFFNKTKIKLNLKKHFKYQFTRHLVYT